MYSIISMVYVGQNRQKLAQDSPVPVYFSPFSGAKIGDISANPWQMFRHLSQRDMTIFRQNALAKLAIYVHIGGKSPAKIGD